ncbi:MAG: class I tRNA ligase family protein [bacterium]
MKQNNFYITTTLPYVNSDPHVGFALEVVAADAIARYRRLMGQEVFFSTGTDEHGQKIYEAAEKAGKEVKDYVDYYAAEFRKLKDALNPFRRQLRAHDGRASCRLLAQEIWKRCDAAGDIYKKGL